MACWLPPPLRRMQQALSTATRPLSIRLPLCRYVLQTYARPELVFVHGEGPRMWDAHGKEYLDFAAGIAVNALGEGQGPLRLLSTENLLAKSRMRRAANALNLTLLCGLQVTWT